MIRQTPKWGANQIVSFATPERMFLDRIDTICGINKIFLSMYVYILSILIIL